MRILTQAVLKRDAPIFDFIVRDKGERLTSRPFSRTDGQLPYCFLQIGKYLLTEWVALFETNGGFDPYAITDYRDEDLNALIERIQVWCMLLEALSKEQFIQKYQRCITGMLGEDGTTCAMELSWQVYRQDLIDILRCIRKHAKSASGQGRVISIVGN